MIETIASFLDTETLGALNGASKALKIPCGKELAQREFKYLERLMRGFLVIYPNGQALHAKILTLPVGQQVANSLVNSRYSLWRSERFHYRSFN